MDHRRAVADARWKSLHAQLLRGLALAALRRAEEVQEEGRATRAAIHQRRLAEARRLRHRQLRAPARPSSAQH